MKITGHDIAQVMWESNISEDEARRRLNLVPEPARPDAASVRCSAVLGELESELELEKESHAKAVAAGMTQQVIYCSGRIDMLKQIIEAQRQSSPSDEALRPAEEKL